MTRAIIDRAELARWNAANARSRREYRVMPTVTGVARGIAPRPMRPCSGGCGRATRANAGRCVTCRTATP